MTSLRPWRSQNSTRSGTRAIVPSSFMISQTTPAGASPARRARSTAASVWPERWSTPPARARSGKTWPGRHDVVRRRGGIDGDLDRPRAVGGGDPGRDAVARLDRDGERRAELRLVLVGHLAQPELVAALGGQAEADQPAAVDGHEVDRVGRDELCGDREVALVLAVLVVDDHDEAAGSGSRRSPPRWTRTGSSRARTRRSPGHRSPGATSRSTYLASTSASRFTG